MTPEKRIQNDIVAYLKSLAKAGKKVYVERRQAGGYAYKKGIADLYAVIDGRHIEIEVKAPGGIVRPMQLKWEQTCRNLNILYIRADDIDKFIHFINSTFNSE